MISITMGFLPSWFSLPAHGWERFKAEDLLSSEQKILTIRNTTKYKAVRRVCNNINANTIQPIVSDNRYMCFWAMI